jgi:hypothetical protein
MYIYICGYVNLTWFSDQCIGFFIVTQFQLNKCLEKDEGKLLKLCKNKYKLVLRFL